MDRLGTRRGRMADKKNITKIEALPKLGAFTAESARKKRVAAYARVSTDHEEQETSFEAQKDYYMRMILERPDWELVKVYADQGISAAGVKRRKQFSQMIEDCEAGKIDIVLCKSISRFARNTLDSLTVIRRLKELGIGIWFEKEAIWTLDSKGELLITIMSSISQEESRSISENVKWGRRKMFQDGKGSLAYSRFLGYDRGKHKFEMVINEEEAVIVRRIYRMALQGYTAHTIAKTLTANGIHTPSGCKRWSASTISSICENEKYRGDFCMQKYFQEDFPSKKCHKNDGQLPKYYASEDHEAIIAPEIFDYVQSLREGLSDNDKVTGSVVDFLSSKVCCGKCGMKYGSRPWHSTTYNNMVWQCRSRNGRGTYCGNHYVYDELLKKLIHEMARSLIKERGILEDFMDTVRESQSERKAADVEDYLGCFMERDGWEMYEDLDDLAYIIKRVVVEEDGRLTVELLDGTTTSCDIPEYSPIMKKSVDEEDTEDIKDIPDDGADRCKRCGAKLVQQPGKKRKVFCSDSCRIRWWRDHPEARGRKAVRTYTCIHCGKEFEAGRSAGRKFCSKECYTEHRFGKTEG